MKSNYALPKNRTSLTPNSSPACCVHSGTTGRRRPWSTASAAPTCPNAGRWKTSSSVRSNGSKPRPINYAAASCSLNCLLFCAKFIALFMQRSIIPECSRRITELPDRKYCKKESRRSLELASGYANLRISGVAPTRNARCGRRRYATSRGRKTSLDRRTVVCVKYYRCLLPLKISAALQQPDATVPTKDGVIIAGRPDLFRFRKAAHGFFEERQQRVWRVSGPQLGFCAAFMQEARIIGPLVGILQAAKGALNLGIAVRRDAQELIREGKPKEAESELVVRLDGQDIAAN